MEFIRFDSPTYLIIAAAAVAAWMFKMRKANSHHKPILRFVVICLIVIGLSEPHILIKTDDQCVLFAVDVSKSIDEDEIKKIKDYIALKINEKKNDDRIGILYFDEKTGIIASPSGLSQEELLSKLYQWTPSNETGAGFTDIENALLTASKLFPEGFSRKLVLITDGNENSGNSSMLLDEFRSSGITVDILPVGGVKQEEVIVQSIYAPSEIRAKNPFPLDVSLSSNTATEGRLHIMVNGKDKMVKENFSIIPGTNRHSFTIELDKGGFHDISVRLTAKKDAVFANNSAEAFVYAASLPRVLIATDPSSDNAPREYLGNILMKNNFNIEYMPADLMPSDTKDYLSYDAVILDDIYSGLLSSDQMKALSNAVHEIGTGLVLIGGEKSAGPNGFTGTPIESALPVSLIPSPGERPSSLDLVFVMDKSGSMSEGGDKSKIRLAADAAQSIIDISGEYNKVGIIAFDSESHVITSPGSIKKREDIIKKLQSILPRGSTDLYPALAQAYEWLKASHASHKHVILLSDGKTRERDFSKLIKEMRGSDITISAVSVGRESNLPLMKGIAAMGGGRFFLVEDDFQELFKIFKIDSMTASRSFIVEDDFSPLIKESDVILNGVNINMPVMHGYMVTSPKNASAIPVVSHLGDPVVGSWSYGLGRSVIFTGDDGSRWARDWLRWEGFGRLLVQMTGRSMRPVTGRENLQVFNVNGSRAEIQYEATEGREDMPIKVSAKIISPDGNMFDTKLIKSDQGSYTGAFSKLAPGKYLAAITEEGNGNIINLSRGNFIISEKEEFLTLGRNDRLIDEITSRTGGRILNDKDLMLNHTGQMTERYIPVWPYLFMLAVMLFLADVAIQRKLLNHYIK